MPPIPDAGPSASPNASPERQLAAFLAKFEPEMARRIAACRAELRALLPTATQLVYDNYNFFVIGFSSTRRPSDSIVSLAAAANGVVLSFYYGAAVPDPDGLLLGSGKQNRFIRLPSADVLRRPEVVSLICSATDIGKAPLPAEGAGPLVIQSVSAKQRPRRKTP